MKDSAKTVELREKAAAAAKLAKDFDTEIGDAPTTEQITKLEELAGTMKSAADELTAQLKSEGVRTNIRDTFDWLNGVVKGDGAKLQWREIATAMPKSLGEEFIESDEYKELAKSGVLVNDSKRAFRTNGVQMKAPTDLISTFAGSNAADLVAPQRLPGILPLPQRELTLRDLFAQGSMTSDLLEYAQQTTFDNAAAAVNQAAAANGSGVTGGVKPQSSIGFGPASAPARLIATWMAVTRQTLSDVGAMQSLIDNQGRLMIQLAEEDELWDGDGTAPNLLGISLTPGVQTLDLSGADNLDGIRTAIRMVRSGISRASADGIVLNPFDSEEVDLLRDGNGQYRGGNPIGGFNFNQAIWRLRRVESDALPPGTGLIGAFRFGAAVLQRQPVSVYTTDSHSDFFIRNLVVVLFEERIGFPVYWPSAFVKVTFGDWGDAASGTGGVVSA